MKLVATNGNGSKETIAERTFSTLLVAPTVKPAPGASDGQSGYIVEGIVNPLGSTVTDCHFEYGPTVPYVFQAPCSPTPVGRTEVQELSYNNTVGRAVQAPLQRPGNRRHQLGASAATVKAALQGLSTIGPNGIAAVTAPETARANDDGRARTSSSLAALWQKPTSPRSASKPERVPLRRSVGLGGGFGTVVTTTQTEGGNSLPIVVEAHLTGLSPGATYHFQLIATNGGGTSTTLRPDLRSHPGTRLSRRARTKPPGSENSSLALPECRAYEQVTPPSKGGYRALFDGFFEGNSVLYTSSAANIANSGSQGVSPTSMWPIAPQAVGKRSPT